MDTQKKTFEKKEEKAEEKVYIAIDLKSFYASVDCAERGLDPITTNLVVADVSRTEKTICLAVSPSLKAYGIPGRARLFEVVQKVKEVNAARKTLAPGNTFTGSSYHAEELREHPEWSLDYIAAVPRMALYMQYSTMIYNIYLKYVAPEDIHVYSVDEVFMDVTHYLDLYKMTPMQLAGKMIKDVFEQTQITATAGIGTNLYLCKVRNMWNRMRTVYVSLTWTRNFTDSFCGVTDPLRIFGEWEEAMPKSWKKTACLPWGMWPDALWEKKMNFTTKNYYINCLASMRNF